MASNLKGGGLSLILVVNRPNEDGKERNNRPKKSDYQKDEDEIRE